jgi:hypothetical protein
MMASVYSLLWWATGEPWLLAVGAQVDDRRPQITGDGLLCLIAVALVVLLIVMFGGRWRRRRDQQNR